MIWIPVVITLAVFYYPIAYAFGWSGADDGTLAAICVFMAVCAIGSAITSFRS